MGPRWRDSLVLALVCAALYWVDIRYRAVFYGIDAQASLAHLHAGWLFAVAALCRERLPLAACCAMAYAAWSIRTATFGGAPAEYVEGAFSYLVTYAGLRRAARWLVPPERGEFVFGVADIPRFTLVGMVMFPLLIALISTIPTDFAHPPVAALAASGATQVLFAKFFGVLIVSLPVIVLSTHEHAGGADRALPRMVSWRVLGVGIALPAAIVGIAGPGAAPLAHFLDALLDYRLLVAAMLIWAAMRLRLGWSMPLLVMVEFLFATALARHAGASTALPDVAGLLRVAVECLIAELLVLLLLLYGRERDMASAKHEQASLCEPLSGLPNIAALRRRCTRDGLPTIGFLLLDRSDKISAGLGLRAHVTQAKWAAGLVHDLAETFHVGTGQLVLVLREPAAASDFAAWQRVLERLHGGEFLWLEKPVRVLPYLGIASSEQAGETLDARLLRASEAAFEARERGELRALSADAHDAGVPLASHRHSLQVSTIALARIRAGEIELFFQPFAPLSARAGQALSGEVLCRMRDEIGRLMLPADFLPELQADRRTAELDLAVLRRLDHWLRERRDVLPPIGRVSVNVASQSLASRAFAEEMLGLLDRFALPLRHLCVEVTETSAITHTEDSLALLAAVSARGCHVAIDDFGIGYQSFERLRQIPADVIKIDGSFIRDLPRAPRDVDLVRAIVAVAHAYGAQTVAEWVEDAPTLDLVRELRVDWAQGFHIAAAAPIDDVILSRRTRPPAGSISPSVGTS